MLRAKSWPTASWHFEQSTFLVMVSQGRKCETCTSEWHWLQAILAWREPAISTGVHEHRAAILGLEARIGVAAHAVRVGHAVVVENIAHLVRLVAIDAGGQNVGFFLPQLAADRLRCTASIWAWHLVQVAAMLRRAIEELGSVCGRMLCAVWQETQLADTVSPILSTPSP